MRQITVASTAHPTNTHLGHYPPLGSGVFWRRRRTRKAGSAFWGCAGLKSLCENSWIPAFAGMTGRNTAPKSSAVTPAEAGVQPGQCQTRVFTQTLKPGATKPNCATTAPCPRHRAAQTKPLPTSELHETQALLLQRLHGGSATAQELFCQKPLSHPHRITLMG